MIRNLLRHCQRRPKLVTATLVGAVFFGTLAFCALDAYAVKITMKRVIFEGTKRAEVLTLINNTGDEQAYRLGWRNMRLTEDAGLKEIPEGETPADIKFADQMVIFAPRRVVIPPGGSQQIRLMLRKPKDLAEGEYRSHLWIRPEAEAVKFEAKPTEAGKSAVQIKMLAGVSLPVFVRIGQMTATAKFESAAARQADGKLKIDLVISRQGNRSLYGDLDFICTGGEEKVLRQVRGIAIYPELAQRKFNFSFPLPKEGMAGCSAMRIVYTADKEDPLFKGNVIAQTSANLQ